MAPSELLDLFYARTPSPELPFVNEDEVEVTEGAYSGRVGTVVVLAYAEHPIEFLVEFGDGTDEHFPAKSLRLVGRDR